MLQLYPTPNIVDVKPEVYDKLKMVTSQNQERDIIIWRKKTEAPRLAQTYIPFNKNAESLESVDGLLK